MPSCDASDVQLKTASPVYRRAREARKGIADERYCEAEAKNLVRCPDGYCRCSGELRKKVDTRDHPWGAPHQTQKPHNPPKMTKAELDAAALAAGKARAAMRGSVVPALEAFIANAKAKGNTLAEDEAERMVELEEWLASLRSE